MQTADFVHKPVLFDEVAFQRQRLELAVNDYHIEIADVRYHLFDFRGMGRACPEVARYPVLQFFSLTDINYLSRFVFHYIDTGFKWQTHSFCTESFEFFVHKLLCCNLF